MGKLYSENEFRSDLWKNYISSRVSLVKTILNQRIAVGKNKEEVKEILGIEDNYYHLDEWAYFIKNNFLGGKTYLLLDFDGDKVEDLKLRTIYDY